MNDLKDINIQRVEQYLLPILLCQYAQNGNLDGIKHLVRFGADLNLAD